MGVKVNARLAQAKISAAQAGLNDAVLLRVVGLRIMGWVAQNFQKRGIERPWKPLSANTIASRRKSSDAPLQDTGRLRMSFTQAANNPRISNKTVYVTSNVKYAAFHEFGTRASKIKPKNAKALRFKTASGVRFAKSVNHPGIPQRKMLPSLGLAKTLAVTTIKAAIAKTLKK